MKKLGSWYAFMRILESWYANMGFPDAKRCRTLVTIMNPIPCGYKVMVEYIW